MPLAICFKRAPSRKIVKKYFIVFLLQVGIKPEVIASIVKFYPLRPRSTINVGINMNSTLAEK